jgi:cation diffusion facilitator CzcD-associated flavoprotein CzcO
MVSYYTAPRPTALPRDEISPDLTSTEINLLATDWLSHLNTALTSTNAALFDDLISPEGFWRDIVAFTNDFRSIAKPNVRQAAADRLPIVKAKNAKLTTPLPSVARPFPDVAFLEVYFTFETAVGPSVGIAKLVPGAEGKYVAYILFTALDGIHGHPERVGHDRLRGAHNTTDSYDDLRIQEIESPEPEVIIVGGGHNGLELAARFKALGVKALVLDQYKRIGDNWRLRYRSLSLHDPVWANHLAYMPFPPNWPIFTPAGKLANWLEYYADVLELNVWTSSSVIPEQTHFNPTTKTWTVGVLRDGITHTFTVSHVVMATGLGGGYPKLPPPFPGQSTFTKQIIHSSQHGTGSNWTGKSALVVGACTSAHDISLDFFNNGADVTMLQRSPTYVMSVKNGMPIVNGTLFSEVGPPTELADRIAESTPKLVAKLFHQRIIPQIAALDAELLDGLRAAGFKNTLGEDNSGFLMLALEKAGGYYFDTGASGHIANGNIKVKQGEIDHFTVDSVVFKDGSVQKPDIVVFATGFTGFKDTVSKVLGREYAEQLRTIWSLDAEGELKGTYRDCGIPNCYYMVGNLSAARFASKIVALQVLAERLGVFGERYSIEAQEHAKLSKAMKV